MYRRDFDSWQDLRDLDQPGTHMVECKSLLEQILRFTYSEAPIYGEASEKDVEKQDVSYRLLEEENFFLKSQLLSLQEIVKLKEEEIATLKVNICQLQCKRQEEETCIELQEVSLPDVESVIGRIHDIENILDKNVMEQLNNENITPVKMKIEEFLKERDPVNMASNSANYLLLTNQTSSQDLDNSEPLESNDEEHKTCSQKVFKSSSEDLENRLATLEEKYLSVRRENRMLEDKMKTLIDKMTLLESSLKSCELELIEYDKILTLIKQERYNLIAELRQTKQCNNVLKSRNEFLEEKVVELENQLQWEPFSPEKRHRYEEDDTMKKEILNCYKNRLYEAFKEMSAKEEQIGQLNDSINELVEKFKVKSSLEVEYSEHLKGSEDRLKDLQDEKFKMEETIRQQSKLIDYLQALVVAKERKSTSKINCLKDS